MLMQKTQIANAQRQTAAARLPAASRRVVIVRAASSDVPVAAAQTSRRQLLAAAGIAAASSVLPTGVAFADGEPYTLFKGYATPPTSYGGYGGNAVESVKYTFEYPTGWKEEVPSKVEKGTQGVDGRVVNPRVKGQRAFVITLGRAGEDGKSFRLTDLDSTFQGFAGADYDLQDALSSASDIKKGQRTLDGIDFYDYDIESPEVRYLSSITTKNGKVFALFVKSPTKSFKANEEKLRHILETFKLL